MSLVLGLNLLADALREQIAEGLSDARFSYGAAAERCASSPASAPSRSAKRAGNQCVGNATLRESQLSASGDLHPAPEVAPMHRRPLLAIENLSISFFTRAGEIPAVMNFSATVAPGQALGLVGESRLRQVDRGARRSCATSASNGRIVGGSIRFKGRDLVTMPDAGAAQDPRLGDRDDLPGADGEPQPGDEGRPPTHGSADDPRRAPARPRPAPRRCAWSRRCACPTPSASSAATPTSSRAASSSASSSPWR